MNRAAAARAACLSAGAVVLGAPAARAVEREHHAGVDVGGMVESNESPDVGASLGGHYAYGLTDQFNLMGEAGWTFVAQGTTAPGVTPPHRPSGIWNADVGVSYVLDVLQWVPYAGVMVGADGLSGGSVPHETLLPDAVIALGIDYRFSRTLALGVAAREHMFLTALQSYPSFTQVLIRAEYTWGW